MTISNLFAGQTASTSTGGNTLAGTQKLTEVSTNIAKVVIDALDANINEYADKVSESQTNTAVLDELITSLYNIQDEPVEFLEVLESTTQESMLKSQQSKKSRCKSKQMTTENYISMMTAAIAEMLIRKATGKNKGSGSGRSSDGTVYTEERLAELAMDQDALRKEIRNTQSKKSILKSKAGFEEQLQASEGPLFDKWQELLVAEEQLKSVRVDGAGSGSTKVVTVDETKNALIEMLAEVDVEALKLKDAKELLLAIKDLLVNKEDKEEATDESNDSEMQ